MRAWTELRRIVDAEDKILRGAEPAEERAAAWLRLPEEVGDLEPDERSAFDLAEALMLTRSAPLYAPRSLVGLRVNPVAVVVAASALTDHPANRRGPWTWLALSASFPRAHEIWTSAVLIARASGLFLGGEGRAHDDGPSSVVRAGPRLFACADDPRVLIFKGSGRA